MSGQVHPGQNPYLRDGKLIKGRAVSDSILQELKQELEPYSSRPVVAVILVGEDMASQVYLRMKEKAAARIGVELRKLCPPATITQQQLLDTIHGLNQDSAIHGIMLERPLPEGLDYGALLSAISVEKDVEGLHAQNLGRLIQDSEVLTPATPQGLILICERRGIPLEGADVCIINHSPTVGRPLAEMFLNRNATVTVCHVHTRNLASHSRNADIIVVGVGKPGFLTPEMVKEGAVVLDVGFNRMEDGSSCGDADLDGLLEKVRYITPVPGGVGPVTVASLMKNAVQAFKCQL